MRRFKIFESYDPDEALAALNQSFGQRSSIARLSPDSDLMAVSTANISSMVLFNNRLAHDVSIKREDTWDSIVVNILTSGYLQVAAGVRDEVVAFDKLGVIVPLNESARAVASAANALALLIPRSTIHDGLESLIGKRAAVPVEFDMILDTGNGGGHLIRSSIETAGRQLGEPQSPLSRPAVAARFEEFIINALLHGQPHNHLDAIIGERQPAAPKQVRRAEEYIHAHAGEVVKLSQIAEAAGCSVRALQLAFRTFRDTTPMALLRQARLERAHAELLQSNPGATTVTEIAVKYGFFNIGRFARDYRIAFGQSPSETLRVMPKRVLTR